jgi:hypothetical protein
MLNLKIANVWYKFMPSDSSCQYHKFSAMHGINVKQAPQYNLDKWANPQSPDYKPNIATAISHYQVRVGQQDCLCIYIHTEEMRQSTWELAHQIQLILDGIFSLCDSQVLVFIAMAINEAKSGVPLAFFPFSAPAGKQSDTCRV